jgi:hypothetical protein
MIIVVFVRKRVQLLLGSIDGQTPEIESPIDEFSDVVIDSGIFNNNSPCANA